MGGRGYLSSLYGGGASGGGGGGGGGGDGGITSAFLFLKADVSQSETIE